jgi:hypothetical protein
MRELICLILVLTLTSPLYATSDASGETLVARTATGQRNPNNPANNPMTPSASTPSDPAQNAADIHYKFKLDADLGLESLNQAGLGVMVSTQFTFPIGLGPNLFVGPEADFMLFNPGSIFSLMGGVVWEFRLQRGSHWSFALGAAGGAAFPYGMTNYPNATTWEACGDISILREIDDLSSLRAVIRAGTVDGFLLVSFRMGVEFRFL